MYRDRFRLATDESECVTGVLDEGLNALDDPADPKLIGRGIRTSGTASAPPPGSAARPRPSPSLRLRASRRPRGPHVV
jgi:hypothetical protein